jgi:serine/threonine-protein kinase RsbW
VDIAKVELKIPCQAEYIGVARLVILGVASRTSFSYDEVEDLRLAVGEACTSAIDRATGAGRNDEQIELTFETRSDRLVIQVKDPLPLSESSPPPQSENLDKYPEGDRGIGALLMEILVDEIRSDSSEAEGTVITMVKYLENH